MVTCVQCSTNFKIEKEDFEFYDKLSVTPPIQCPDCRQRNRLLWRNERALYKRTCDCCSKNIISIYSPDTPYIVYCSKCWWSDNWDAFKYGKKFDFSRSFFEQWHELNLVTPKLALINDNNSRSENCEYTNDFAYGKNCYMVFCSWQQESCFYSHFANRTNFSCDVTSCLDCELLYECIDCENCYSSTHLINSSSCNFCYFSYDLKNCSNCLLCSGLRGKEYYIRNKQYTKEEYLNILNKINLSSYNSTSKLYNELLVIIEDAFHKNLNLKNCQECLGDYLVNCKNVYVGYDFHNAEDSKYIYMGDGTKSSYDICNTGNSELCYESITCDDSYNSRFTIFSWKNKFATYTNDCHSCENIFGCISLKQAKYCILNKIYTPEEYFEIVNQIIIHMKNFNEWGLFFPEKYSPFKYEDTLANEFFPAHRTDNFISKEIVDDKYSLSPELPDLISDTSEEICGKVIKCINSAQSFKITKEEFKFYQKLNIPLPRLHPNQRHLRRSRLRNYRKINLRNCYLCKQTIPSTHSKENYKILCETCYLKEIY